MNRCFVLGWCALCFVACGSSRSACPLGTVKCDQGDGEFTCVNGNVACETPFQPPIEQMDIAVSATVNRAEGQSIRLSIDVANLGSLLVSRYRVNVGFPAHLQYLGASAYCQLTTPGQLVCGSGLPPVARGSSAVVSVDFDAGPERADGGAVLDASNPNGSTFDAGTGRDVESVTVRVDCAFPDCSDADPTNNQATILL